MAVNETMSRRIAALGTVLVAAAAISALAGLPEPAEARAWVAAAGPVAPLLYLACYLAGALLFVPRPLLTVAGGLLFGPVAGIALAVLGGTLAALGCFLLARATGLDLLSGRARLARLDQLLRHRGWLAVAWLRLLPVLPFSVVNYGCGLTSLRTLPFVTGTALGSLPGTALLVLAGESLTEPTSPTFLAAAGLASAVGLTATLVARGLPAR